MSSTSSLPNPSTTPTPPSAAATSAAAGRYAMPPQVAAATIPPTGAMPVPLQVPVTAMPMAAVRMAQAPPPPLPPPPGAALPPAKTMMGIRNPYASATAPIPTTTIPPTAATVRPPPAVAALSYRKNPAAPTAVTTPATVAATMPMHRTASATSLGPAGSAMAGTSNTSSAVNANVRNPNSSGSGSGSGSKRPLMTHSKDGKLLSEKKLRRLEKNRLSARECRRRKREATENLERQINILEGENLKLRLQLQIGEEAEESAQEEQQKLTEELSRLLESGAAESEIYASIEEFKEKFADYGRNRRSAIEFHLRNIERLLMPTHTTNVALRALRGGTFQKPGEPTKIISAASTATTVTAAPAAAATATAPAPAAPATSAVSPAPASTPTAGTAPPLASSIAPTITATKSNIVVATKGITTTYHTTNNINQLNQQSTPAATAAAYKYSNGGSVAPSATTNAAKNAAQGEVSAATAASATAAATTMPPPALATAPSSASAKPRKLDATDPNNNVEPKSLFTYLAKHLEVTESQQALLKDSRYVAQEMDSVLEKVLGVLTELRTRLTSCGEGLEAEFDNIRSILTPTQAAKFVVWVANNKACMHMLNELWSRQYPYGTSTGDDGSEQK